MHDAVADMAWSKLHRETVLCEFISHRKSFQVIRYATCTCLLTGNNAHRQHISTSFCFSTHYAKANVRRTLFFIQLGACSIARLDVGKPTCTLRQTHTHTLSVTETEPDCTACPFSWALCARPFGAAFTNFCYACAYECANFGLHGEIRHP